MLHCLAFFKKRAHGFVLLFIVELIVYILADCIVFKSGNTLIQSLFNGHFINIHQQCNDNPYPTTYYRKKINDTDHDYTYYVYNIAIGEILLRDLSEKQIENYSAMIQQDLLQNIAKHHNNKSSPERLEMRRLYNLYYNEFHSYSYLRRCNYNDIKQSDIYTSNFFEFIHYDTPYININTNASLIFYDLRYYDNDKDNDIIPVLNKTRYFSPKLFSYTLSVSKSSVLSTLSTLEFRFGEINGLYQHDSTRHLLLNGVHNHLLWSGEFFYIYDYKYKQYTMILDTASGHFKPKISAIPHYLEYILVRSLFPNYNIVNLYQNDTYKPLIMIGYNSNPWHEIKKVLFPVSILITQRDKAKKQMRRNEKKHKLKQILANKSCSDVIKQLGERIVGQTQHTMEAIVPYIITFLNERNIGCDQAVTFGGWSGLGSYKKQKTLYHLLNSY